MNCTYCKTPQPAHGFFCPNCFKQNRCKHCSEALLKDIKICIVCGKAIGQEQSNGNLNTIKFSESEKERKFEASFTDTIGQSISESFGMILTNRMHQKKQFTHALSLNNEESSQFETLHTENVDILNPNTSQNVDNSNIPSLQEIKMRDLPKSEPEWLLVYAYFASKYGKTEFTKEGIIQLYNESGRKTESRMKNLSNNLKNITNSLYVKPQNNKDFTFLEKGKNKILDIFNGNSSVRKTRKSIVKSNKSENSEIKAKKNKSSNSITYIDLSLSIKEQKLLNDFFTSKNPASQLENVLVVMKWYIDHKNTNEISIEEINYLLNITSSISGNLAGSLKNMTGKKYRWVTNNGNKKYQISTIGEKYIQDKLSKS